MTVSITIPIELFLVLKGAAVQYKPLEDDFCVNDYGGGNIDDAYYLGCKHGEQYLAKCIMENYDEEKTNSNL